MYDHRGENTMIQDIMTQKWDLIKEDVRSRWNMLSEEEVSLIDGKPDRLMAFLRNKSTNNDETLQKELDDWTWFVVDKYYS